MAIINGTPGDDILEGTFDDDQLFGEAGNDTLRGKNGDDLLFGGDGNDGLYGGKGDDNLLGGDGDDYLNPGDNIGFDSVDAGLGNDTIDLSGLTPGDGFFSLSHSSFYGLTQGISAIIDGPTNTGSVDKGGASGTTTIINVARALDARGVDGGMSLSGTDFDDAFRINPGDNGLILVRGQDGADSYQIGASTGTVRLSFAFGVDGGMTADLRTGVIGDDGYGNRETITGTGAVNELRGTMYNDKILGSGRDESFILEGGTDTLDGRGGVDLVRYDRFGVEAVDVDLAAGTATGIWRDAAFTNSLKNIEDVRGSRFDDDILRGTDGANALSGRGGDDVLYGRGGRDALTGGDGDDTLIGGSGADSLVGDGPGRYFYAPDLVNSGKDTLKGGKGNDILNGGLEADVLNGGLGRDTASYADATDRVRADLDNDFNNTAEAAGDTYSSIENLLGSAKGDWLTGNGGRNRIDGGKGNDRIEGGNGNDILNGGRGKDVLNGGANNDKMSGGAGADRFIFSGGNDVITDFNAASNREKIDLSGVAAIKGFKGLKNNYVTQGGNDLVIDDGAGNTLTLLGLAIGDLDKGDFIF